MAEIVTVRTATTLPSQNVNGTVRKATTLPGQNAMEHRHTDLLGALGVLTYLLVAATIGGAVVSAAAWGLRAPVLLPAAALALVAYAAERTSRRACDVLCKNVALAVYVAAALLLPAPWPVLIAAVAITACQLTRPGASTAARLLGTAHTITLAALLTVLAHALVGDGRLLHSPVVLPVGTGHLAYALFDAPSGARQPLSAAALVSLALGAYLLDTLPLVAIGALRRGTAPWRAWHELYGRTLVAELAAPIVGILGALTCAVAWPAVLLILPFLVALYWGLEQAPAKAKGARQVLRQDAQPAAVEHRAVGPQAPAVEAQARLSAVLAAVRALGGNDDLGQVTRTLACAAAGLTTFRDCTVYLYESHDGLFVPYACNQTEPTSDEAIPREAAESLMSHRHRLGYSYYAQTRREPGAGHEGWRAGDVLLVPLLMKNGDVMGFISLDRPADRQVPQADDLAPLETIAALGAGVIARLRHTDEVLRLATTDGLTGLLNRRALEERLHRELQANGRLRSVALMMIDLDDFGAINNHHGHQIGDEALRLVAEVVRTHLRRNDAGGRYGGDEFVVILPDLDAVAAVDVAERVRTALVEATTHAAAAGKLPRIHTSIGVALFPDDATSPDALIKAADEALYLSKRLGKNCVSVRSAA
jgi:diguanylate cyclase (GGDEF)-like protein